MFAIAALKRYVHYGKGILKVNLQFRLNYEDILVYVSNVYCILFECNDVNTVFENERECRI